MASWTSDHSMILSQLLDEVTGTQEIIDARQDYCRMVDCLESKRVQGNIYFTGSKAEGLDLPGSDTDLMHDVNGLYDIRVIQSLDENVSMTYGVFLMSTENMPAEFTLLQQVHPTPSPLLYCALQNMNDLGYLSSDLFLQMTLSTMDIVQTSIPGSAVKRQGPSMELWGWTLRQSWIWNRFCTVNTLWFLAEWSKRMGSTPTSFSMANSGCDINDRRLWVSPGPCRSPTIRYENDGVENLVFAGRADTSLVF